MAQAVGEIGPHPARAPSGAKEITTKRKSAIAFFLGRPKEERWRYKIAARISSSAPLGLGETYSNSLPTARAVGYVLSPAARARMLRASAARTCERRRRSTADPEGVAPLWATGTQVRRERRRIRPFQGRTGLRVRFPGALPPAILLCPCRA